MNAKIRLFVTLLLIAVMALSIVPASKPAAAQDIKVRLWLASAPAPAQAAVDEWNKNHPDKLAELVSYSNNPEGNAKVDTALLAAGQVDVLVSYGGLSNFKRRADAGLITPIQDLLPDFDIGKEFGEAGKLMTTWEGKTWGAPAQLQPYMMYINKNAWEEAGLTIPEKWTWDEFIEMGKKVVQENGLERRNALMLPTWAFAQELIQWEKGADYGFKDKCTSNMDDPLFAWAMDLRYKMETTEKIAIPYADIQAGKLTLQNEFVAERTVIMLGGTWLLASLRNLKDYPHEFVTAFAPIPTRTGDPMPYRAGTIDDVVGVAKNSNNPEIAAEFLRWFTTDGYIHLVRSGRLSNWTGFTPEQQAKAFIEGLDPAVAPLFDMESFQRVVFDGSKPFTLQTFTTGAAEISQIYTEEATKVFIGEQDGTTAGANIKKRSDEVLAKLCAK